MSMAPFPLFVTFGSGRNEIRSVICNSARNTHLTLVLQQYMIFVMLHKLYARSSAGPPCGAFSFFDIFTTPDAGCAQMKP